MKPLMSAVTSGFTLVLALAALPNEAGAQLISLKTVPVAAGDQFLIFPSINMSMGGISIALDDPLYDPFVNPAKGINIQGVHFISAPTYYGISMRDNFLDDASSARTLPVGMLLRQGTLFGGAVMAWQELSKETDTFCCVAFADFAANTASIRREQSSTSRNNIYAFALAGAQLPGANLSVGASVFVAGLNGLEGVRLLYDDRLVFHDEEDRDVPWQDGASIARAAKDANLVRTSGLGHRRIIRDPAVIRQAVDFMRAPRRASLSAEAV